ncbi:TPA: hypothetical protein I8Y25_004691 [Raoultella ornithinolytica]|nr:hypothetical protein [Raoultella ornithinolytica]HAT1614816.1 hypothetical protein [Raoultella ornithinolytica]
MNKLQGINTGIIQSEQGVLALVLKAQSAASADILMYLPPERVQALIFAVFSCYRSLQLMHCKDPQGVRAQAIAEAESFNNHVPIVTLDEIQRPDASLRVDDFVMKSRQHHVNFLFFLQNDDIVSLDLALPQMEYLLNLLLATVQKTEDTYFISRTLQENDFIPFYTVDFMPAGGDGVKYNQFNVPTWKSAVFGDFYSLVIILDNGEIPCGIIIKAVPELEPNRAKAIGELLLNNNTLLAPYRGRTVSFDYEKMDLAASEEEKEKLLRAHIKHRQEKIVASAHSLPRR